MTAPRDPDLILAAWLDEGPTRLPTSTRRAILVSTRTTHQQRRRTWLPRRTSMLALTRVAVLAMVIAVVGPIGLNLFGSGALFSPGPIDTSDWTTYNSERYGFSIAHPADWTERPADHIWTMAEASVFPNPADEAFMAPDSSVRASAWSVAMEPGTKAEAWIAAYCELNTTPCADIADRSTPIVMDRHPGSLVRFADDTQAFIKVGDRMYVVAVWEPDSDSRTAPYGGAVRLLEGYLSTMSMLPGGPAIDTTDWTPYTSDRYGFSIGHPADWTERAADHTWTLAEASVFPNPADEAFMAPEGKVRASAWSVAVEPGTTADDWIATYCPLNTKPCTGIADRTVPVTVDGHPGSLVRFTDDSQAFVLIDGRMYVVAVWRPESDPSTAPYGGTTRLLKGYLSTMRLLPGGAAVDTPIRNVSLGIYSGRPDPSWDLTQAESAELARLLGTLPSTVGDPPQGGLGYHGFVLDPAASGQADGTLVAYRGTVADLGSGSRTYLVDVDRTVERYLLDTGRSHLSATEIDAVEADLIAATGVDAVSPRPS